MTYPQLLTYGLAFRTWSTCSNPTHPPPLMHSANLSPISQPSEYAPCRKPKYFLLVASPANHRRSSTFARRFP